MPAYTLYYFNGRGRAEAIRMMFGVAGVQFTDKRIEFNEWDKFRTEMPSSCMPVLEIDGKNNRMPETMAICRYLAREFGFYGKANMEMFRNDYICDCLYEIMHDYMRYFHEKNGRFRYNMSSNTASSVTSKMASGMTTNMASGMTTNMASNMKSNMSSARSTSTSSTTSSDLGSTSNKIMSSNMTSGTGFDGSFMKMRFTETCRRVLPFLERTLSMHCGGNKFFMGEQIMMCDIIMYCFLESPMTEFQQMFNSYPKLMSMWKRVSTHPKISGYLQKRVKSNW